MQGYDGSNGRDYWASRQTGRQALCLQSLAWATYSCPAANQLKKYGTCLPQRCSTDTLHQLACPEPLFLDFHAWVQKEGSNPFSRRYCKQEAQCSRATAYPEVREVRKAATRPGTALWWWWWRWRSRWRWWWWWFGPEAGSKGASIKQFAELCGGLAPASLLHRLCGNAAEQSLSAISAPSLTSATTPTVNPPPPISWPTAPTTVGSRGYPACQNYHPQLSLHPVPHPPPG